MTMDHPEPLSTKRAQQIPQCKKGFTLEEAKTFVGEVMDVFRSLDDMSDLRSMYETGKQLSRAYFDCHSFRSELAQHLTFLEYPSFASKMMKKLNNMGVFKNDDIWFSSFYFYNSTWNFSETWPEFATALATAGLPNLLNLNIGHQPYLENLASKNVYYLIKASLSIIHNIARVPGNVNYFTSETVKQALFHLSQREEEFLRCVSSLCLAYILADGESGNTPNNSSVLQIIINYLQIAKTSEKRRVNGFQVTDLLSALSAYSVNNSIKESILASSINSVPCITMFKDNIISILNKQNGLNPYMVIREAEESIKALINLSFEEKNTCKILNQLGTWNLETNPNFPQNINRSLEILSLQLNSNNKVVSHPIKTKTPTVFFSYALANKPTVLKFAERIKESGVSNINCHLNEIIPIAEAGVVGLSGACTANQSVETWLNNVDTSHICVVFLSDVYRLSPACRYECERFLPHANRRVMFVNLQNKYKPSGWLAEFIENRYIYDFTSKKDIDNIFDSFVGRLQENISEIQRENTVEAPPERKASYTEVDQNLTTSTDGLQINRPQYAIPVCKSTNEINQSFTSPQQNVSSTVSHSSHPVNLQPAEKNLISTQISAVNGLYSWKRAVRPEVRTWNTTQVASWLRFRGLSQIISNSPGGLDGIMLSQFAALRLWAPEYFGQCLKNDLNLNLFDSLRLLEALDELGPEENQSSQDNTTERNNELYNSVEK